MELLKFFNKNIKLFSINSLIFASNTSSFSGFREYRIQSIKKTVEFAELNLIKKFFLLKVEPVQNLLYKNYFFFPAKKTFPFLKNINICFQLPSKFCVNFSDAKIIYKSNTSFEDNFTRHIKCQQAKQHTDHFQNLIGYFLAGLNWKGLSCIASGSKFVNFDEGDGREGNGKFLEELNLLAKNSENLNSTYDLAAFSKNTQRINRLIFEKMIEYVKKCEKDPLEFCQWLINFSQRSDLSNPSREFVEKFLEGIKKLLKKGKNEKVFKWWLDKLQAFEADEDSNSDSVRKNPEKIQKQFKKELFEIASGLKSSVFRPLVRYISVHRDSVKNELFSDKNDSFNFWFQYYQVFHSFLKNCVDGEIFLRENGEDEFVDLVAYHQVYETLRKTHWVGSLPLYLKKGVSDTDRAAHQFLNPIFDLVLKPLSEKNGIDLEEKFGTWIETAQVTEDCERLCEARVGKSTFIDKNPQVIKINYKGLFFGRMHRALFYRGNLGMPLSDGSKRQASVYGCSGGEEKVFKQYHWEIVLEPEKKDRFIQVDIPDKDQGNFSKILKEVAVWGAIYGKDSAILTFFEVAGEKNPCWKIGLKMQKQKGEKFSTILKDMALFEAVKQCIETGDFDRGVAELITNFEKSKVLLPSLELEHGKVSFPSLHLESVLFNLEADENGAKKVQLKLIGGFESAEILESRDDYRDKMIRQGEAIKDFFNKVKKQFENKAKENRRFTIDEGLYHELAQKMVNYLVTEDRISDQRRNEDGTVKLTLKGTGEEIGDFILLRDKFFRIRSIDLQTGEIHFYFKVPLSPYEVIDPAPESFTYRLTEISKNHYCISKD